MLTCGSVDDGKSTLLGRLLYDADAVMDDQLAALDQESRRWGTRGDAPDFALLLDGLSAEREQGITIDVAYRYFSTRRRSFIVADTPGHEQYTRNMATGASTADLAIILVDARKGVLPQTRRHAFIAATLGVRHAVLAINKMDLVGFSRDVWQRIANNFGDAVAPLGFHSIVPIPLCARDGDNVVGPSERMAWFTGPTLLEHLETVSVEPRESGSAGLLAGAAGDPAGRRFPRLRRHGEPGHFAGRTGRGRAPEPTTDEDRADCHRRRRSRQRRCRPGHHGDAQQRDRCLSRRRARGHRQPAAGDIAPFRPAALDGEEAARSRTGFPRPAWPGQRQCPRHRGSSTRSTFKHTSPGQPHGSG